MYIKTVRLDNQFAFYTLRFECKPFQDRFIAISVFPAEVSKEFGALVDEHPKRTSVGYITFKVHEVVPEVADLVGQ